MNKKLGFTLAEVLITLGIIGVVAAMTIPTLIANTNSAKFRSQFKKTISTLNQAGLMAQAQYDIDFGTNTSSSGCAANDSPSDGTKLNLCAIFNGTLSGHTLSETSPYGQTTAGIFGAPAYAATTQNQPTLTTTAAKPANAMFLTLADGSLFVFDKTASNCTKEIGQKTVPTTCVGYIDVNGPTLPNKEVSCTTSTGSLLSQPAYADTTTTGGETATGVEIADTTCKVPNDANHMTDIYPVAIHDATVEPLTAAAKYVLTTSK